VSPRFGIGSIIFISLICLMGIVPVAGTPGGEILGTVWDSLFNLGYNKF